LLNLWQWIKQFTGNVSNRWLGHPFVQNIGTLASANILNAGLSFVQAVLVARWLGPQNYGIAALVMSYPNLVHTFFDFRSTQASVKYLSQFHARHQDKRVLAMCQVGYGLDLIIAAVALLVILVTAPLAATHIVHKPEMSGLIGLYAVAYIPRALIGTSRSVLNTLELFPLLARLEVVNTVLRVGLVVSLVLSGFGVIGVVGGSALAIVIMGGIYLFIALRQIRQTWAITIWQNHLGALRAYRNEIISFLGFNNLDAFVGMIPKQMDEILLGYFSGPADVGYYRMAKKLASVATVVINPVQTVTFPKIARLVSLQNYKGLTSFIQNLILRVGLPGGSAILFGGVLVSPFLIQYLLPDYTVAVLAAQLWFAGYAAWFLFIWVRSLYLALNRVKLWLAWNLVMVVVFLLLAWLLAPSYGFTGMTIARLTIPVFVPAGGGLILLAGVLVSRKKGRSQRQQWTTKFGLQVKRGQINDTPAKIISGLPAGHAALIKWVIQESPVSDYFPQLLDSKNDRLCLEWVSGQTPVFATPQRLRQFAEFFARLHNTSPGDSVKSFDYPGFLIERVQQQMGSLPAADQQMLTSLIKETQQGPPVQVARLSYPDLSPHNLVWLKAARFKIIDIELIANGYWFGIDFFNMCHTFKLSQSEIFEFATVYRAAGGNLDSLFENRKYLTDLWVLRNVGALLHRNSIAGAQQILERAGAGQSSITGFEGALLEAFGQCR